MFNGWPTRDWIALPNVLLTIQAMESPYAFSILTFLAAKTYGSGQAECSVSYTDIEKGTGIGRTKVIETIKYLLDSGYIVRNEQGSPGQDSTYSLRYGDSMVAATPHTSEVKSSRRLERYSDWFIANINRIVQDTSQKDRNGKILGEHQRKLKAALWAYTEVFGTDCKYDAKVIIEQLASCGGSAVKVGRWYLQHADVQFEEDQQIDKTLLARWKARVNKLGKAGEQRTGLINKPTNEPQGRRSLIG